MFESKLGNRNSGRNVSLSPDVFGSGMYGLEDMPKLLGVCYEYLRAGVSSKLLETLQAIDIVSRKHTPCQP